MPSNDPSEDVDPKEVKRLHLALGEALTMWQAVESALFSVFCHVSGCADENVASAIFYSPNDFSEKLKCTHNAARIALSENPLLDYWAELRKRMINASEVRNALAHFTVIRSTEFDASGNLISSHLRLRPNFQDVTEMFKQRKPTVENLSADYIIGHIIVFQKLTTDVKAFADKIP